MIGRLRGLVAEVGEEEALIDVAGVGYVVRCGSRALGHLPALGEETVLHIESIWSESNGMKLYGFLGRDERRCFVTMLSIQGVGPKAALAVLDVLAPPDLAAAVARDDKAALGRANGVGPKLALRLITELKDKQLSDSPVAAFHAQALNPAAAPPPSAVGEAVAALLGLGVAEVNARRVIEQAALRLGEDAEIPALIKAGLQELGR
ncbi:ATP-dependent DNA helicase RuvA [Phenylobacterium sp. Root77]|jgi:Holliday junction DNA helicase RuvA|uniref:Holliday junction branch migration protein RuvA n=1 Tax=unclassified Phenylobacterium TaxID=2640670 RepID=UPI0006F2BE06|nr:MULTISPECIES: Holliday junction branch migration protein RuvA [unclassified Phenylobacterium]KQW70887.1 ATP-dependent DNA helicase RuvA [Phenylobacterium sp. Root1277]KQW90693.1 ATP-dependent DNA helicase RuvA [Phenylobacterium sp. Root1290]KRC39676.1 ATP-dependent DNA helicase RuvA [Phenylobacterium sp. Root77]